MREPARPRAGHLLARSTIALLCAACYLPGAGALGFAGSREVRLMRVQLEEACARVESQARHIEALYALAGHSVSLATNSIASGAFDSSSALGSAGDDASNLLSRERAKALEQLEVRWVVDVGAAITAVAYLAAFTDGGSPRFLFAADEAGTLHVYNRAGERLLALPTEQGRVTAMAFGSRDDPFVVTASSDGTVAIRNVTFARPTPAVRPATPAKGGKGPSPSARPAERAAPRLQLGGPLFVSIAPDAPASTTNTARTVVAQVAGVTAVEVWTRGKRTTLFAGTAAGSIHTLSRNGTLGPTITVGSGGAVLALRRSGSLLAYASETEVGLLDLQRNAGARLCSFSTQALPSSSVGNSEAKRAQRQAEARTRTFADIAFDAQLPQLLFASTQDGNVHVFNTRARRREAAVPGGKEPPSLVCKHVGSFRTGHAHLAAPNSGRGFWGQASEAQPLPAGAKLGVTRGFVLAASPALLSAHNVSELYLPALGVARLFAAFGAAETKQGGALAPRDGSGAGVAEAGGVPGCGLGATAAQAVHLAAGIRVLALAGVGGCGSELRWLDVRLVHLEAQHPNSFRVPLLVACLLATVGYQLYKSRSAKKGERLSSRTDLDELERELEVMRGGSGAVARQGGRPAGRAGRAGGSSSQFGSARAGSSFGGIRGGMGGGERFDDVDSLDY
ncbi:hypothetical protein T492DRAFT_1073675 [Pavlovales sp. CCMP2436]|nr:hypothetical protein T492DRAFT_1073675 [Pavlovales sp. CCMP2436]